MKGFTLLEMVVVLLILAVLMFFAYPAFTKMLEKQESRLVSQHIHNAIRMAKIETLASSRDVIICAMNEKDECSKSAQQRFVAYVDKNRNSRFDKDDYYLLNQPLGLKYGMIHMRASLGRDYMKFMGDTGRPRGNFGHIRYCSQSDQKQLSYQIVINAHGVVSQRRANIIRVEC